MLTWTRDKELGNYNATGKFQYTIAKKSGYFIVYAHGIPGLLNDQEGRVSLKRAKEIAEAHNDSANDHSDLDEEMEEAEEANPDIHDGRQPQGREGMMNSTAEEPEGYKESDWIDDQEKTREHGGYMPSAEHRTEEGENPGKDIDPFPEHKIKEHYQCETIGEVMDAVNNGPSMPKPKTLRERLKETGKLPTQEEMTLWSVVKMEDLMDGKPDTRMANWFFLPLGALFVFLSFLHNGHGIRTAAMLTYGRIPKDKSRQTRKAFRANGYAYLATLPAFRVSP